jgi:2-keto-4-pentenoate hydratase/2-oxohepta-3-ene-1,7-dioic acid hydratase in catechol pathway
MTYAFNPAAHAVVPTSGGQQFPVHRIDCVGRNCVEHTQETGQGGREPPNSVNRP